MSERVRLGVVGTGFVSRHLALAVARTEDAVVGSVLTRRSVSGLDHPAAHLATNDLSALLAASDVVVECSGDPLHATEVIAAAIEAGRPVVTVNAEFHVTAGSAFVDRGVVVTEAEGDQPGSEAALAEEARGAGFRPLAYGSMKGFLEHMPSRAQVEYWSRRQGTSVPMTMAFTDGTKVQIEQALVANGLGATIAARGLLGIEEADLKVAGPKLAEIAIGVGQPVSDFVLAPRSSHGVFVVAEHDAEHRQALQYLKMGEGPYYVLVRPSIFAHLEVMKTVRRVVHEDRGLLDNSATPVISVAAVAKRALRAGTRLERGIGSFDVRGEAVVITDEPDHVPIGLLQGATVVRPIEAGATLSRDDVELPDSLALRCWASIRERVLTSTVAVTPG
jgi:predicted homoserine dehydrogenase-like protein